MGPGIDETPVSRRQIVHDGHVMAFSDERVDKMRTDKSGAAGD